MIKTKKGINWERRRLEIEEKLAELSEDIPRSKEIHFSSIRRVKEPPVERLVKRKVETINPKIKEIPKVKRRVYAPPKEKLPQPSLVPAVIAIVICLLLVAGVYLLSFGGFTGLITFTTVSQNDFNEGTFTETHYNTTNSAVQLNATGLTTNGSYLSKVFNAGYFSNWENLSWVSNTGELPDNLESNPSIDMSGNVLLFHLNNDDSFAENVTHFYDFSGNNNNGTLKGADGDEIVSDGKMEGALDLDGGDDYISVADSTLLDFTTAMSFAVWIKPDFIQSVASSKVIFDKTNANADAYRSHCEASADDMRFRLFTAGGATNCDTAGLTWTADTWHHWAGTYNGTHMAIYWDGIQENVCAKTGTITTNAKDLYIGEFTNDNAYTFDGTIDEIAFWNRSLNATEIRDLYIRGMTKLDFSVRNCDDSSCSGETFTDINDTTPESLSSFYESQYFQYNISFETIDKTNTSRLYNVTIEYVNATEYNITFLNGTLGDGYLNGSRNNVVYNTSINALDLEKPTNNGSFLSPIIDSGGNATWLNISWKSSGYGELSDNMLNEESPPKFGGGNINMTGNVLLMHMNNDSSYNESNTLVYDFSDNDNNGTPTGAVPTSGYLGGGGYNFSAASQYITVSSPSFSTITTGNLTVMAWGKVPSAVAGRTLISQQDGGGTGRNWITFDDTGSCVSADISSFLGGSALCSGVVATDDQWTHVALTYNGSDLVIYINGVEKASSTRSIDESAAGDLIIGEHKSLDGTLDFEGGVDEVAIWNRSLSADEIKDTYIRGVIKLNLSVRSCNDSLCDVEQLIDINDTSPQTLNINSSQYFQYNVSFETESSSYTPELYNVTIHYNITPADVECGTITSDTTLTKDLTTTGTCFTIGANNIVLNGAGRTITGDQSGSDYGVSISDQQNITIKNAHFVNFQQGVSTNPDTDNLTIYNNTFSDATWYAMTISGDETNVSSNRIEKCSSQEVSIGGGVSHLKFYDNTLSANGTGEGPIRISKGGANHSEIFSNTFITGDYGIQMLGNTRNLTIRHNNFWGFGGNDAFDLTNLSEITINNNEINNSAGIRLTRGKNISINHNNFTTSNRGMITIGHHTNITMTNNTFFDMNQGVAVDLYNISIFTFQDNEFSNLESTALSTKNVSSSTIINNKFVGTGAVTSKIVVLNNTNGTLFYNNQINHSGVPYEDGADEYLISKSPVTNDGTDYDNTVVINYDGPNTDTITGDDFSLDLDYFSPTANLDVFVADFSAIGGGLDTYYSNDVLYSNCADVEAGLPPGVDCINFIEDLMTSNGPGQDFSYSDQFNATMSVTSGSTDPPELTFESNVVPETYGLFLDKTCDGSFINNTFNNATMGQSGRRTGCNNSFSYENTWGEIKWADPDFLENLTVNADLWFDESISIGNNSAALDTSVFVIHTSNINSTANITLKGLDLSSVNQISFLPNYTTNSTVIRNAGYDCNGSSCWILSYSSGTLTFNTTSFSSFAGNATAANSLPTAPVTLSPTINQTTTNRTPALVWANATDADGDAISYHLQVDDDALFQSPAINITAIAPDVGKLNTTYAPTTVLDVDTMYHWRVRANDSTGYGPWSNKTLNLSNFTVQSYLAFSLPTSTIEFGSLAIGAEQNTTDGTPAPFRGENTGNLIMNISINGTKYFTQADLNTSNYQFKIRENDTGAFNTTLSRVNWTNMSKNIHSIFSVVLLNWRDAMDDFLMDLNITVPTDEPSGVKFSNVTFTVESSGTG